MSQTILCPVCETENAPDAINCEVCGERLAPLAPGEVLDPEENVMSMLNEPAPPPPTPEYDAPTASFSHEDEEEHAPFAAPSEALDVPDPERPAALYSPISGEAFFPGSPEYEEGFGPMGEQLQLSAPAPPLSISPSEPMTIEDVPSESELDHTSDDLERPADAPFNPVAPPAPISEAPPAPPERESPFRVSGPNPGVALPRPGTYQQPATLTVFFQRQPVLEFPIETDEVLIGRKDIRADIDPDIDLTPWDHNAYVSRKHAYIYRQNKNYTLYAVSNGGLQLNNELLDLGQRRQLNPGDVIVIAGILAMKFQLPE